MQDKKQTTIGAVLMAAYPPQLPSETQRAYHAACLYFGLGRAERSIEQVRITTGKPPASRRYLERWSSEFSWVARSREYDQAEDAEATIERTNRYLADLEDHRTRYQQAGRSVYGVAARLLQQFNKDIDSLELTPATLSIVLRAFTTAGDLEAHALNLDEILPKLAGADDDRG